MLGSALSLPHAPSAQYRYPASAGVLVWRRGTGTYVLTAIVKATFDLVPGGQAKLANRQLELSSDVQGDIGGGRLAAASDWAPYKPLCDVAVVGVAHPNPGETAYGAQVAVQVDDLSRRLRVPSRQPVRELAPLSATARVALACQRSTTRDWAQRMRRSCPPAPPDVDFSFFNAAPADLWLKRISAEPLIVLEGLMPDRPRLACRLPRLAASATVRGAHREDLLELRCDTLWIDASSRVATLTWRGVHDLYGGIEEVQSVAFDLHEDSYVPPPPPSSPTSLLELDEPVTTCASSAPPPSSGVWVVDDEQTRVGEYDAPLCGDPLPFVAAAAKPPSSCVGELFQIEDGDTSLCDADSSLAALPFVPAEPAALPEDETEVIGLRQLARLGAQLDMYPDEREQLLEQAQVDEPSWRRALEHWKGRIQQQGRRGCRDALIEYDDAYVAEIEDERGTISLRAYALLSVAAERDAVPETAAALLVPEAATLPVERVWTRRLLADPSTRKALKRELQCARESTTTSTEE